MADVVVRDVPDEVVAGLDARARRLGLSRGEYLRRRFAEDVATQEGFLSVDDLAQFSRVFADLADEAVMSRAWR